MCHAETWIPPEHPDAHAILHDAVGDTRAGRYEVALAKHVWFHENALRCDSALYGVRLSFALGYWRDLADKYAPAMQKLVEARETAESEFHELEFPFQAFHDVASLNRILNESHRTADAFITARESNPEAAAAIYHVAEPALIASGRFEICGDYLNPERQLDLAKQIYRCDCEQELEWASSNPQAPRTARLRFVHAVTTLVALLVKNHRSEEAQRVKAIARSELDDLEFQAELDRALAGRVPAPLF